MKAIHLLIATLIMTTQVQRIFWKERMAPEVLHTRKTILTI